LLAGVPDTGHVKLHGAVCNAPVPRAGWALAPLWQSHKTQQPLATELQTAV
jgi:hypothetical protein